MDGLRGVAAIAVVLFHLPGYHISRADFDAAFPDRLDSILARGQFGVHVFFVLSGFVIAYSLRHITITVDSAWRFIARRSLRLDPPYWIFLITCASLGITVNGNVSAFDVLGHLAYLEFILRLDIIDNVFWTLCIEIQWYLFYLVVLLVSQRTRIPVSLITLPLLFVSLPLSTDSPFGRYNDATIPWYLQSNTSLLANYVYFYLGSTCSAAYQRHKQIDLVLFVGGCALAFTTSCFLKLESLAIGATSAAFIYFCCVTASQPSMLCCGPLQFLGRISYSLYLTHWPVLMITIGAVRKLFPTELGTRVAVFTSFSSCIGAAYFYWRLIEQPSLRISKRIDRSSTSSALGSLPENLEIRSRHNTTTAISD